MSRYTTNRTSIWSILSTIALFPAAHAETPLTGVQLHEQCLRYVDEPRSSAGIACATYIRGFLDGAAAVDGGIRSRDPSGQTGVPIAESVSATVSDRGRTYCVESSVTIDRIVAEVLKYTGQYPPVGTTSASELLDSVLRQFHACR